MNTSMHNPKSGDKISIRYACYDEQGQLIDEIPSDDAVEITLGQGVLLTALEAVLMQMQPGEKREVALPPKDAFGDIQEELFGELPLAALPKDFKPVIGAVIEIADAADEEPMEARIIAVSEDNIEVDANHPLAGLTMTYSLELLAIIHTTQRVEG